MSLLLKRNLGQEDSTLIAYLLLLLLVPPAAEVKAQTQKTLAAMETVSALQVGGPQSYRVSMFGGKSRNDPVPYSGLFFGSEWSSLLQDSQKWALQPEGDHYTYYSQCPWTEIKQIQNERWHAFVPCEGEVYVEDANIIRIVQRLSPRRTTKSVTIDVQYGWVTLRERRLVPLTIKMVATYSDNRVKALSARWIDYHEWAAESIVKDIDGEDGGQLAVKRVELQEGGATAVPAAESPDAGIVTEQRPKTVVDIVTPPADLIRSSVKVSRWGKLFRILRPF